MGTVMIEIKTETVSDEYCDVIGTTRRKPFVSFLYGNLRMIFDNIRYLSEVFYYLKASHGDSLVKIFGRFWIIAGNLPKSVLCRWSSAIFGSLRQSSNLLVNVGGL